MATAHRLCVGILTALVLLKSSCLAQVNTTEPTATVTHCHRHGNTDNCTDSADSGWNGHFSQCPDHLKHYCIHGECRYILDQKKQSCRCDFGYDGHRCEYIILPSPSKERRKHIIIGCVVAGLVLLILLLVFTCVCSRRRRRMCWRRGRRREEPGDGAEKLGMMEAETHTALKALDPRETHTNAV